MITTTGLPVPVRPAKPRDRGLTMMIDGGLPTRAFEDTLDSFADHVDLLKFGWGTSLVTPDIKRKRDVAREHGVQCFLGGTLFEKYALHGMLDAWLGIVRELECEWVEVSNGTIAMSDAEKSDHVAALSGEFRVLAEVGFKDVGRAELMTPQHWVQAIRADLAHGASLVVTETRESGRSGICHPDGTLRDDVVGAISAAGVEPHRLLFEAPTKDLQLCLLDRFGPDVNLGNVAPADLVPLETLRLGLRSETVQMWSVQNA